jgi:hypothetical protein
MNVIRIIKKLESDNIPELKAWIGRTVEIIVLDHAVAPLPAVVNLGTGDWDGARRAIEALEDYDFDAVAALDEADLRDSARRLP